MFFMNAIMISHETMEICQDNLWISKKGLDGESLVTENFTNSVFVSYGAYGLLT